METVDEDVKELRIGLVAIVSFAEVSKEIVAPFATGWMMAEQHVIPIFRLAALKTIRCRE
jgi:hypothetical protein